MLPQWHEKDPGHSAKIEGGRLHRNMHTSMAQQSQSGLTMLSRHNVGTCQEKRADMQLVRKLPQSSQLAEPLWTDPGQNWSEEAGLNLKNFLKPRQGMNLPKLP